MAMDYENEKQELVKQFEKFQKTIQQIERQRNGLINECVKIQGQVELLDRMILDKATVPPVEEKG